MGDGARRLALAFGPPLVRALQAPATLAASIEERAQTCPDGRFWTYDRAGNHRSQSYAETWQRSRRIATGLRRRGARTGGCVVLLMQDVVDLVPAFWACILGGFVAVPLASAAAEALHLPGSTALQNALARLDRPLLLVDESLTALAEKLDAFTVI